ncbi:MAG TPA: methyltransferase domain-containing protein, partial [Candidatus Polarisedimenticolia bacterium]|nr:methyltransferase domain-containing protein [Candidatus Polarisedimenticolia bacterium]
SERARLRLGPRADSRRFIRLDVTRQLPPYPYDGVLLLDVIEHLPDDLSVMKALSRYLSSSGRGGFLLLTVPAFSFLWSPWDDLEHHRRRYTASGLRRLAENAGFEVERITYFFLPLFFAAASVKALRGLRNRLSGTPAGASFSELAEARSHPLLNRVMLGCLAPERVWLRRAELALGTSLLCVARPR